MQMNRLFELVYLLLDKQNITAKELAVHFEVSVRTIYRDIEILCQSGIPIYANKGRGGGIGLMKDFVLDKSVLTDQEKHDILWALQGIDAVKAAGHRKTLTKLRSLFGVQEAEWLEVDFSDWGEKQQALFHMIKEAIIGKKVMEFDYYNSKGERSRRQAEPFKLWFKSKAWYLKAYCRQSQDFRLFKLVRLRELEILSQTFSRDLSELTEYSRSAVSGGNNSQEIRERHSMVTVKLHIDGSESYRIFDEFEDGQVVTRDDGSYVAFMTLPENEWLYGYILSYGECAKVLEPERIRAVIKDKLIKMEQNYI